MSSDCVQDILSGLAQRRCQYNGDEGVHRGFIPDLHADFLTEGLFRDEYSLQTVEESLTAIHQFSRSNGVYVNYVGPGPHRIVVPMKDTKGRPVFVKVKDVDILPDDEGCWSADGVDGYRVLNRKTHDLLEVTGNALGTIHPGLLHVVQVIDGAERWLLTSNGVGAAAIQRMRAAQGDMEWSDWIATLNNGRIQQLEVQAEAESALGNRPLANDYWRKASALSNNRANDIMFRGNVAQHFDAFRREISWLQPAMM